MGRGPQPTVILSLVFASIVASLPGCTPRVYRQWADAQVGDILEERTETTLGYTPAVNVESDAPVDVDAAARRFVPLTVLAAEIQIPIELVQTPLPVGDYGPPVPEDAVEATPGSTSAATALARQFALEGLIYGPLADGFEVPTFGLAESLQYAIRNSRDYQDEVENLYIVALDVTLARHLFEPRFFADGSVVYDRALGSSDFASALRTVTRAGVRQQLPYGGEVTAVALVNFVDALDGPVSNSENAEAALTAAVPLLRGAGFVNLEPLVQSERDVVYAVRNFERFRRAFAVVVAVQYFNLVNLRQSVRNNYLNYLQNVRLVEQTESQFAAGFNNLRIDEVQRAVNALLRAEDAINDAQVSYANALDDFKVTLGMPVSSPLEIVAQDIDVDTFIEGENDALAKALSFRLDLQTARDQVNDARRGVDVARNNLLPSLGIVADVSVANENDDPASDLDRDTTQLSAGFEFALPLDRVAERNNYRRSLIGLERSARQVEDLEASVISNVRGALRRVRSAELSLRIQQASLEVARRRLDFVQEQLRLGVQGVETQDVVDAQDSLLGARESLDRAQASLLIERLRLLRDTGTLRVDPNAGLLGLAMNLLDEGILEDADDDPS